MVQASPKNRRAAEKSQSASDVAPLSLWERAGVRGKSASFVLGAFSFVALAASVRAADQKIFPSDLQFFESKIRPIFVENCYKCHSQGAEKIKGGLLLDTRDGALKGGDSGPALVAGDPDNSLLVKAVRYTDEGLQMPPRKNGGRLSDQQITDLEAWAKMGAPD